MAEESVAEGELCEIKVAAKNPNGDGIGKLNNFVIFIRNAKTKIGKIYKVKITKVHRTFAYAEPVERSERNVYIIGKSKFVV
ncbi:MAG: TRAM domain-containing protein [Candidatus Micrarchaeia archaeon]